MSAVRIKLLKLFLVFETCPKTELLRNTVHHKIQSTLVNLFRMKKLEVHEEIHCRVVYILLLHIILININSKLIIYNIV